MSTLGDKLGYSGRPTLGQGFSVPPEKTPELIPMIYPDFREGIDLSEAPENVRQGAAVLAIDMELSNANRLVRAPGIPVVTDETPRLLQYLFEHSSVDYLVELVGIDPPRLGYKGSGAFTWVSIALANTGVYGWNAINYLGYLIFSNGADATYARAAGAAVVTDISADVIAKTMAVAFGRKFAGYTVTAGLPEALRIKWDDTTATFDGWGGTGSGSELLLSNSGQADYIVAMRPFANDLLAILNRKTLWAGYRTGVSTRPADFRHRFSGVGCVHERTVATGVDGVIFLSDDGVVQYNINEAKNISGAINPELLPLDYTQLGNYSSAYDAARRRYYLGTPDCVWIYEFAIPELKRPGRWFKRGVVVDSMVAFSDQAALVAWNDLTGTWDAQTQAWNQFGQDAYAASAAIYFGKDTRLGRENSSIFTAFGATLTPKWRTPQENKVNTSDQFITHGFEIEYQADADSLVSIKTMNVSEDFTNIITRTLPATAGQLRRRTIWGLSAGVGVQAQVEIASGYPQIARIRQLVERAGDSVSATVNP